MILDSEIKEWIQGNQGMLIRVIEALKSDMADRVVDEENAEKKQVLSELVKEMRKALIVIENVSNQKDIKKPEKEFTGM